MNHKDSLFKKADIFLAAFLLALALLFFLLPMRSGKPGAYVSISVDGKSRGSYPLSIDRSIRIDSSEGYNIIEISGGQVSVSEADCPNGDCMRYGRISKTGQIILCLPHRLAVTIVSEEDGGPDAISY